VAAAERPPVAQECVEGYVFAGAPPLCLLLRRPPERDRIWVPVSGKVEPTDPDYPGALRRELREETGYDREILDLFPLGWEVEFDGPDGRRWRLHAFGVELAEPTDPRLSPEHDRFEWVPFEEAHRRLHYADNREAVAVLAQRLTRAGRPSARARNV
jgi:8-oxo-dGTP pyrophosphatase MutT (NUDIX family)